MLSIPAMEDHVWKAIQRTINKFREHPAYFFTESDITSYLYRALYSKKLEVSAHGRKIYTVHREYPTNFRYEKQTIASVETVPSLVDPSGKRGNYDLAVLDPTFVANSLNFEDVVNKDIRGLIKMLDRPDSDSHLVFAIELKYIINSSKEWIRQIEMDNAKMKFAIQNNVTHGVNLVFCNTAPTYIADFKKALDSAAPEVCAVFIQSHYDQGLKKTPLPHVNVNYQPRGNSPFKPS